MATLSFYEKEPVLTKKEAKEVSWLQGLNLSPKQIIAFLLEFMAVSAVFLAVWYYIGEFYQGVIFFFAKHILLAMGYTLVQISAVNLSGTFLVNEIRFPMRMNHSEFASLVYASIGIGRIALQLIIWFVIIISAFNSNFLVCRVSPSS